MRHKKMKLCAVLLLGLGLTELHAQEAITASGGNASGSEGSVSYSVGQVSFTSVSETTGSVAQGVQQPYEISVVTSIENTINLDLSVFPNPSTDYLILNVGSNKISDLRFQLYEMSGKLIESGEITDNQTNIAMSNHKLGTYLLKITNNKTVKEFKIIKN